MLFDKESLYNIKNMEALQASNVELIKELGVLNAAHKKLAGDYIISKASEDRLTSALSDASKKITVLEAREEFKLGRHTVMLIDRLMGMFRIKPSDRLADVFNDYHSKAVPRSVENTEEEKLANDIYRAVRELSDRKSECAKAFHIIREAGNRLINETNAVLDTVSGKVSESGICEIVNDLYDEFGELEKAADNIGMAISSEIVGEHMDNAREHLNAIEKLLNIQDYPDIRPKHDIYKRWEELAKSTVGYLTETKMLQADGVEELETEPESKPVIEELTFEF